MTRKIVKQLYPSVQGSLRLWWGLLPCAAEGAGGEGAGEGAVVLGGRELQKTLVSVPPSIP